MREQKTNRLHDFVRTKGEVYVWLASMGLVIGLTMIVFLLGLILWEGVKSFWPEPVAVFELRQDAGGAMQQIAGQITKEQEKAGQATAAENAALEYQIRTANRDTYGSSYRYLDSSQIASVTYPSGLVEVERMEFGNAVGFPESVVFGKSGRTVASGSEEFAGALAKAVQDAATRRAQIEKIEKKEIGSINAEMTSLRNRERSLKSKDEKTAEEEKEIAGKVGSLQGEFEKLATRARELRGEQKNDVLVLRLASGETRTIATGDIVGYFYPNDLGFFGKLGLFFHRLVLFLIENPREANTEGGIYPAIFGTVVMTLLMSVAVMPFGIVAAIYLREYAKQGFMVRCVRIAVNNLAGVPSIVFGVFGLGFFVYLAGGTLDQLFFSETLPTPTFGTGGVLWAALTLALMTVPVVIVATEESLAAVPRGVREGSLACGASKWQTIQRVVLPAAAPGILTGLILAMARGAGEVAPLMLVGVVKLAPSLPLDGDFPFAHLERKFMHLGFHIFDLGFQSPDAEAAKPMVFATTLLLILLVVFLNLFAIIIRERLRKKYATGAF